MRIADFAEIADVFYDVDFISSAAQLFCNLEFIEKPVVLNRSRDVQSWLYDILGYSSLFTDIEREALSHIENAGELSPVVISNDDKVRLFAIELESVPDRSIIAYTIHCIFSKEVGKCSTILFRQTYRRQNFCMFSMDVGKDIILSDWLTEDSDAEKIFDISAENLSCDCSENFQTDMADIIGRSYYKNTFSKACIYDLLAFQGSKYRTDGFMDWESLRNDVENLRNKALYDYGDDYVEPKPGDGLGEKPADIDIPIDILLSDDQKADAGEKDYVIDPVAEDRAPLSEDVSDDTELLMKKLKGKTMTAVDLLKALEELEKNGDQPGGITYQEGSENHKISPPEKSVKIADFAPKKHKPDSTEKNSILNQPEETITQESQQTSLFSDAEKFNTNSEVTQDNTSEKNKTEEKYHVGSVKETTNALAKEKHLMEDQNLEIQKEGPAKSIKLQDLHPSEPEILEEESLFSVPEEENLFDFIDTDLSLKNREEDKNKEKIGNLESEISKNTKKLEDLRKEISEKETELQKLKEEKSSASQEVFGNKSLNTIGAGFSISMNRSHRVSRNRRQWVSKSVYKRDISASATQTDDYEKKISELSKAISELKKEQSDYETKVQDNQRQLNLLES